MHRLHQRIDILKISIVNPDQNIRLFVQSNNYCSEIISKILWMVVKRIKNIILYIKCVWYKICYGSFRDGIFSDKM